MHDLVRQQRLGRFPQQHLLRQPPDLVARRQREREIRHGSIEVRNARLERMRHRGAVRLDEEVVDEIDAEVEVLETRKPVGALRLGVALV